MPRERRKERQTEDGPARAERRGAARRADGRWMERRFLRVLLRSFFSPRSARARYQYYHNFTFVIGWHRASVTCRAPFASPFSVSLSFFEPFILSSGCSLCPFLPSLSLPLYHFLHVLSLLSSSVSHRLASLYRSPFPSLCRCRFRDSRPRTLLARFWSLFVTPAIVP